MNGTDGKVEVVQKIKRTRCKNYLEEEKEKLVDLANRYKHIIENKRTDAVWVAEKNKAWEEIAKTYNSTSKTGIRTATQLKLLFEGMKKGAKKHKANDKVEVYKTGGGPPPVSQLTESDSKIIAMLGPQMESLKNSYDSNAELNTGMDLEGTIIMELDTDNGILTHEEDLAEIRSSSNDYTIICNNPDVTTKKLSYPQMVSSKLGTPSTSQLASETTGAHTNKSWESSFIQKVKAKQTLNRSTTRENEQKNEFFTMKKLKHEKQMVILDIIQKKEQVELEVKLLDLETKKKSLQ